MRVPKAVVVAGRCGGSAPWPLLGAAARQLTPIANRPILFHHLDGLAAAGVREAMVLTDEATAASISAAVGDGSAWDLDIRYVEQSPLDAIPQSRAIAEFVGSDSVLVQHGDVLLHEDVTALREQFADRRLDALVMHAHAATDRPPATDGYLIGPGVYPDLCGQPGPLGAALVQMRAAGARIQERDVDACVPCRGGVEALLAANRRMLEAMPAGNRGERIFDSRIQGSVVVHPSAEIRESLIRGPVTIGPGARITNAYVGPYTSIAGDVVLDCVEIEHSIVLDRARLRFVGTRTEDSLIGPDARVERSFQMPQALRLSVGSGAAVAIP